MHCLVLNGNPQPSGFDDYLARSVEMHKAFGQAAELTLLRRLLDLLVEDPRPLRTQGRHG